jgi:hypothetical protein
MSDLVPRLQSACEGFFFPSETDAPLTPFFWSMEAAPVTPQKVTQQAQSPADAPVQTQPLNEFFAPVTEEADWMNEDERATCRKFGCLQQVLQDTLQEPHVYRIGHTRIDVYVVRQVEGGCAGIHTQIVET